MSLVELMIALGIIAIAMFGILSMILHSMQTKETMRELQLAKEAVATKIEEIKSHPMQLPTAAPADMNSVYQYYNLNKTFRVDGLTDSRLITPDKRAIGTVLIDSNNTSLYEVVVTVEWNGRKGPGRFTRRSLIAQ